jgi:hypothetical protein
MAEVQASVSYSPALSKAQTSVHNEGFVYGSQNYVFGRKPEYFVYLYSVSTQEHKVSRPPLFDNMRIPGVKSGEKAHFVGKFPQPLNIPKGNVDSNEVDFITMDSRRFVTDIINPDNLTINQEAFVEKSTSGGTNDLGAKGVFWSYNGPGNSVNKTNPDGTDALEGPSLEEVDKAIKRMEKRYLSLIDEAKTVEASDPKRLPDVITPELHAAAEYFHITESWHRRPVHKENCVRCGLSANVNVPFHPIEGGGWCVGSWDAAIKAGVRSRAQAYEATEDERYAPKVVTSAAKEAHKKAELPAEK